MGVCLRHRAGRCFGCKAGLKERGGLPALIVGSFERLSAFALGLFGVSNAPVILGAWLAAKLAASWGRYPDSADATHLPDRMELNRQVRVGHLVAVIGGDGFGFGGRPHD